MNKKEISAACICVGSGLVFWIAAKLAYDSLLSGVPDSTRWPIAALPCLLVRWNPSRPWSNGVYGVVWGLAVGSLFVPAFTAWFMRGLHTMFRWAICVCIVGFALVSCGLGLFGFPEGAPLNALWLQIQPSLWAVGICVLGVVAGRITRNRLDANKTDNKPVM